MNNVDVQVSVIMPAYNAAQHIEASIRSVLSQTVADWELLVIDDCSSDSTVEVVTRLAAEDSRIRLIKNEKNLGASGSRNKALGLFKGRYVAFLDSDDLWYPEKLEKQICTLEKTNAGLCYSSYCVVHLDKGNVRKDYIVPESVTVNDLLKQNYIGCSTVMLTAEVAREYRFTKEFYHEDYIYWLTIMRDGIKAVGISDVMMDYSFYASSKSGNKLGTYKHRWRICREFMGCSVLESCGFIAHNTIAGIKKYIF